MTALRQPELISIEEYLAGELVSDIKHEYLGGEVHAMAGAANRHNRISTNITTAFSNGLRGRRCEAFNSDTKVRVELPGQIRFYYPDAMIVCDRNPDDEQWQDRPVVIVEVLSDSTRRIDLTEKREAYFAIPSLRVLIFVETARLAVTVHRRSESGEFLRETHADINAVIPLPEVEIALPIRDIYERIEF
jgi:Uma2 family endonuclease